MHYHRGRRNKALEEAFNSKFKIQKSKILGLKIIDRYRYSMKTFLILKDCQAELVEAGGK